ncbi:MAG: hypothetical protein L0Y58_19790 [Verrucomicrobia subdivision 3 bacterium]|nr:hypothetical protein [Limisphaerales bacterium]
MPNPFEILAGFLDRYSDDVEGRSLEEPSSELKLKLQQLARGSLSEAQRDEVILILKRNPQWVSILASEAKAMRAGREK